MWQQEEMNYIESFTFGAATSRAAALKSAYVKLKTTESCQCRFHLIYIHWVNGASYISFSKPDGCY